MRIRPLIILCSVCLLIACGTAPSNAHTPHDPASAIALSPDFGQDGTLILGQFPALSWDPMVPMISTNRGESWRLQPVGVTNRRVLTSISVSPAFATDRTVLAVAAEDGLFLSIDAGAHWSPWNNGLSDLRMTHSEAVEGDDGQAWFYASGSEGHLFLARAPDGEWAQILEHDVAIRRIAVSPTFSVDHTLVVADRKGQFLRSTDGGSTWGEPRSIPGGTLVQDLDLVSTPDGDLLVFAATDGGLFRSRNDEPTFEGIDGLPDGAVPAVGIPPGGDGSVLYATGEESAIYISEDAGETWRYRDAGVPCCVEQNHGREFYDFLFSNDFATDGTVFLTTFYGLFRSDDAGDSWLKIDSRPPSFLNSLAVSPDPDRYPYLLAGSYEGGMYASQDLGASWFAAATGIANPNVKDAAMVLDADGRPRLFTGHRHRIAYSTQGGERWTDITIRGISPRVTRLLTELQVGAWPFGLGTLSWALSPVRVIFLVAGLLVGLLAIQLVGRRLGLRWRSAPFWLAVVLLIGLVPILLGVAYLMTPRYAVTRTTPSPQYVQDGQVATGTREKGILMLDGDKWHQALDGRHINTIAYAARDGFPPEIYASTSHSNEVFLSIDGGGTFEAISKGLPEVDFPIRIAVSSSTNGEVTVAAATFDGLFLSHDKGGRWTRTAAEPLATGIIRAVAISPTFSDDGMIVASVRGHGLFRSEDRGVTWVQSSSDPIAIGLPFIELVFSPTYAQDARLYGLAADRVLVSEDRGDNWREIGIPLFRHEEHRHVVSYKGRWKAVGSGEASHSRYRVLLDDDAEVALHFYGTGVRWIGVTAPELGLVDVYLDGHKVESVDQGGDTQRAQVEHYSIAGLPREAHQIRLVSRGKSSRSRSRGWLAVDAFDVYK